MQDGDIIGHEGVGVVEEVGAKVTKVQPGDKVVISAVIACGTCDYCKKRMFSCCDNTNPSKDMEEMYGDRIAALFGYSRLTGGYDGTQAEYVRVPYADTNLMHVSQDTFSKLQEKLLLLADVACTGWHACELGEVGNGDVVGIWGCGPVGLMAASWAKNRGASRIIAIDDVPSRLKLAQDIGAETINFKEVKNTVGKIRELVPKGLDVGIDAVGFRYASKSVMHKVEKMLYAETDSVDVVVEVVKSVKKGGRISLIGDYIGVANHFPVGALMEKSLTLRGGQLHPQKYWPILLPKLLNGEAFVDFFTHRMPLTDAPRAYKVFDAKEDGVLKIVLTTKATDDPDSSSVESRPIEETIIKETIV